MKNAFRLAAAAVLLSFIACNNGDKTKDTEENAAAGEITAPVSDTAYITLEANDRMKFDKDEIHVSEGQTVVLTLKHIGTAPKETMGHNFVLLQEGTDVMDFGTAAAAAADNDYIPQSETGKVIAYTKLLGGGESDKISFAAPPKGSYPFLCSFPGHFGMMKGLFIVN